MSLALSGCPGADRDSHNGIPVKFKGVPEPSSLRLLSHSGSLRPPRVKLLNAGPAVIAIFFFRGCVFELLCVVKRFFGRVSLGMVLEYTAIPLTRAIFPMVSQVCN